MLNDDLKHQFNLFENIRFQAKLCLYLNETTLPTEQSEALGISVDLYHRLVRIRKTVDDDMTYVGHLNVMVNISISIIYHDVKYT